MDVASEAWRRPQIEEKHEEIIKSRSNYDVSPVVGGFWKWLKMRKCAPAEIIADSRDNSPTIQKKVDFDLRKVGVQDFYEYRRKLKWGKYPKPFDPLKKPHQSVLKDSTPSPISPFYKRAWNINYWTPTVTTDQLIEQAMLENEDADVKEDMELYKTT